MQIVLAPVLLVVLVILVLDGENSIAGNCGGTLVVVLVV
jgi:hypothetical protein